MKQRSFLATIAAFVLGLAIFSTTAHAQGGNTESQRFPVSAFVMNSCCNEMVEFSGNLHLVITTSENPDGTTTRNVRVSTSGVTGTGSTGINYKLSENAVTVETFDSETIDPYDGTQVIYSRVVGKGKNGHECSYRLKITTHFATDANGNIIIDDFDIEIICANGAALS